MAAETHKTETHKAETHKTGTRKSVKINRAPVLTLWAAVVAERLGHSRETALTLGKTVAGLNAQSKGRRLGIYEDDRGPDETDEAKREQVEEKKKPQTVELLGRAVPVEETKEGLRALVDGKPVSPGSVERYLESKFKDALPDVRAAFEALAKSMPPRELEKHAYDLYEEFRPEIPEGVRGWGAAGVLDLDAVRARAK
jgi:hypothetical protein